jgi:integrase
LLLRRDGSVWSKSTHQQPFERAAEIAGLTGITIYALRHSAIVRDLLAGVPIRVVAAQHDTSVAQIESTYSKHIVDHADEITRRAMLDIDKDKIARLPVGERV